MHSATIYRFDAVTVDVSAIRVCRGTTELALEPKSFRLLQLLIENRERVLGKEEIFRVVWRTAQSSRMAPFSILRHRWQPLLDP